MKYFVTIGTKKVVAPQVNLAACALEAKDWARRGYQPAIQIQGSVGSIDNPLVRVRLVDGIATAEHQEHPFAPPDRPTPAWVLQAINLINEQGDHHGAVGSPD